MSLRFGAANSVVEFAIGNVANLGNGAFTLLILWKHNGNSGLLGGYNGVTERQSALQDSGKLFGTNDFSPGFGPGAGGSGTLTIGNWYWLAVTKAAGAAHYRYHIRDYTGAGAWAHGEPAGEVNHGDPGVSDRVRVGAAGVTSANGDVAVAAVWTSALADLAVEAAATAALVDLVNAAPGWAVKFKQGDSAPAQDLIGTGHESSRSGTITDVADPPGYVFDLVSPAQGAAQLVVDVDVVAAGYQVPRGTAGLVVDVDLVAPGYQVPRGLAQLPVSVDLAFNFGLRAGVLVPSASSRALTPGAYVPGTLTPSAGP